VPCPVPVDKDDSFPVLFFLLSVGKEWDANLLTSMSLLLPVMEQTGSTGISGQREGGKSIQTRV